MEHLRLAEGEYRFARIVWEHEPLPSGKLVELSQQELGWKKSTTYTVLKKLCQRGILQNERSTVAVLAAREEVAAGAAADFVDRTFGGSLPGFLTAFMGGRTLTEAEAEDLKRLIDRYKEG